MKKVLVFAGSARGASINKKLAAVGAEAIKKAGGEATLIDLNDYPAAIYNGDDEDANGLPEPMRALKKLIANHDAMMIASPEYNGFFTPLLVNALSWVSRPEGDESLCAAFKGKKAALMAASPGGLGGVRAIPRLRDYLSELGVMTVSGFATVPKAYESFDDKGTINAETTQAMIEDLAVRLLAAI